jgi:hypothetical protein
MHSPRYSQQHLGFIPYGLPKVHSHVYKPKKVKFRGACFSLFCNSGFKEMLLMGAHPMFHKKMLMGPINMAPSKRKKLWVHPHDLINMNCNKWQSNY